MKKTILGLVLVGILFLIGCQVECPDCIWDGRTMDFSRFK